jgi:hypothetical protein
MWIGELVVESVNESRIIGIGRSTEYIIPNQGLARKDLHQVGFRPGPDERIVELFKNEVGLHRRNIGREGTLFFIVAAAAEQYNRQDNKAKEIFHGAKISEWVENLMAGAG